MSRILVKDGEEDQLKPAMDYLDSLGIPRSQIRRVVINGEINQMLTIEVTLYVEEVTAELLRDTAARLLRLANEQEGYEVG